MNRWQTQVFRYGLVGIGSNLLLYIAYLAITGFGVGHKLAMTGLYLVGVLQTFAFNKLWAFAYRGKMRASLARYVAAYAFGYLLNLAILHVFVDVMGKSHELVQGLSIILVAVTLFLLQRYWVFSVRTPVPDADHCTTRG